MLQKIPYLLSLVTLAIASTTLQAEDKIDQVLNELRALRHQVETLEERVASLESQAATSTAALESAAADVQPRERKNLFDHMRIELKKAEVRASGPWTNPAAWDGIETGLSEEEVIETLGEPTDRKFSVRRDTDEIFYYRGDLEGSGEPIEGEIRIYKGKVRRFSLPDFPTDI